MARFFELLIKEYPPGCGERPPWWLFPFKNRWCRVGIFCWNTFWTTMFYLGWQPLAEMLYRDGAYRWRCDSNDIEDPCESQYNSVQLLYTVSLMLCALNSLFAGIALDFLGPKITGSLGVTSFATGFLMLTFSSQSVQLYIPAFCFLSSAVNWLTFSSLEIRNYFPNTQRFVISLLVAMETGASAVPLIQTAIWNSLPAWDFRSVFLLYFLIFVLPSGIFYVLALPWTRLQPPPNLKELEGEEKNLETLAATVPPGESRKQLLLAANDADTALKKISANNVAGNNRRPSIESAAVVAIELGGGMTERDDQGSSVANGRTFVSTRRRTASSSSQNDDFADENDHDSNDAPRMGARRVSVEGERRVSIIPLDPDMISDTNPPVVEAIRRLSFRRSLSRSQRGSLIAGDQRLTASVLEMAADNDVEAMAATLESSTSRVTVTELPARVDFALLKRELSSPEFFVFMIFFIVTTLQYGYYPTTVRAARPYGPEISDFLGWITPSQALWGILLGLLVNFIGTMPICAVLVLCSVIVYTFAMIDIKGLQYVTSFLSVVGMSYAFTTRYVWVNEVFQNRNFGTLIGIIGASSTIFYPVNMALQRPELYDITYVVYLCFTAFSIPAVIYLLIRNRKRKRGQYPPRVAMLVSPVKDLSIMSQTNNSRIVLSRASIYRHDDDDDDEKKMNHTNSAADRGLLAPPPTGSVNPSIRFLQQDGSDAAGGGNDINNTYPFAVQESSPTTKENFVDRHPDEDAALMRKLNDHSLMPPIVTPVSTAPPSPAAEREYF